MWFLFLIMEINNKKRIEFIDLAKGICIILVVIGHCGVRIDIPGMEVLRMPLYFILSGLFFKHYGGFYRFSIKKYNKILIPFLFFYIIGYSVFYFLFYLKPSLLITSSTGILDVFINRQYFNGPIWFLLCLFWCNIIFFIIVDNIKSDINILFVIVILGFVGYTLGNNGIFIPLFLDVSLTALPFFCFGFYLKRTPLLYPNQYDKWNVFIFCMLFGLSYLIGSYFSYQMGFHYNNMKGGFIGYIIATCSVIAVLLFSKTVVKLPVISYLGQYSIIVLCIHHLIYRPVKVGLNYVPYNSLNNPWVLSLITLTFCYFLIAPLIKVIPQFVAQKDLVRVRE